MTTINLHGLLAQEYQKQFVLKIDNVKDIVRAIDANRKGFLRRLNDLQREGLLYNIIVNGGASESDGWTTKDIKQVDLVPVIAGAFWVGAMVSAAVGAVGAAAGAVAGAVGAIGGAIGAIGAAAGGAKMLALAVGASMLSKALAPQPEQTPDVGGATDEPVTFESRAASASMMFNNVANIVSQGAPVPIGYGRLKIGSSVIQSTVKSFPMSTKTAEIFLQNPFRAVGESTYVTDMQDIYTAEEE